MNIFTLLKSKTMNTENDFFEAVKAVKNLLNQKNIPEAFQVCSVLINILKGWDKYPELLADATELMANMTREGMVWYLLIQIDSIEKHYNFLKAEAKIYDIPEAVELDDFETIVGVEPKEGVTVYTIQGVYFGSVGGRYFEKPIFRTVEVPD